MSGERYPPMGGYVNPFGALIPSTFPPEIDPNIVACFQMVDQDGSGLIDDEELQRALSSYKQSFSLRTVRLLMSGKIDANELREALLSLGFAVSPVVLDLLVSKFDKTGDESNAIEYDNFIEYD
ncbi:hypothetical protein V6N11_019006 [Hibiscus sabdariffa]|uniref:EF-hand domain-containing protein n=1 Tax=Hibiscus sabdariffa TaxID=183260 RepID=A0ABR2R166_9ROSI